MEAIKKKIAALKLEMDAANEKVEVNETKAKQEDVRADRLNDDLRDLQKRLSQLERDYSVSKTQLEQSTADLEQCEKSWSKVRMIDDRVIGDARRGRRSYRRIIRTPSASASSSAEYIYIFREKKRENIKYNKVGKSAPCVFLPSLSRVSINRD